MADFNSVKLEKGLYSSGNFTSALESIDSSEQYAGTPLEGLDAYQRQLKRFGIRVSGPDCDKIEKFFTTTESAVLFPEFVRRAVKRGMEESLLPELTAAVSKVNGTSAKGFAVDETDGSYSTVTAEGAALKKTAVTEDSTPVALEKFGRLVTASYETVRQQRIDVFAVMLRAVGRKIAGAAASKALAKIKASVTSFTLIGSTLAYADLAALFGKFSDYDMTTVIASPKNVAAILAMTEMRDRTLDASGTVRLPFGAKLLKDSSLSDKTVIGISKDFAMEAIMGSDVLLETDRLIDCQLDRIAVTVRIGFQPLMSGAAAVLDWNT